jgi:hypothetical protein
MLIALRGISFRNHARLGLENIIILAPFISKPYS